MQSLSGLIDDGLMVIFEQVESVFEKPDEKPEEEQSTFASEHLIPCYN